MKVVVLQTVPELLEVMPLILEGYRAMNKRQKVFDVDEEGFAKTMFGILNLAPDAGILVIHDEDQNAVGYGAAYECTPAYSSSRQLLLYALYVKPGYSSSYSNKLFEWSEKLATERGFKTLVAYNGRFSGAAFRLFENAFGMRRKQIRFTKNIL